MENTENTSQAAAPQGGGGAKEKIEKQARQLAYDTRYKVKQQMSAKSGSKLDPAAVRKAYAAQLSKSPAAPQVKARAKQMLLGEDIVDINKLVSDGAASALYKVFVEHHEKDADGNVIPHEDEEVLEEDSGEKSYKVRVTDKKTNNTYVRNATRDKIRELRANPNISSVEMTQYGEPTKSEKYKGKQTAATKAGKDYDGDGKVESPTAEYKGSKDKAIKKAMKKEDYSWKDGFAELLEKKKEEEGKKITGKGVDNKKLIKVFPDEVKEQVGQEEEKPASGSTEDPQVKSKEKRISLAKRQILLKKMQAVKAGATSDIQASHKPEGQMVEEGDYGDDEEAPAPGTVCFDGGAALPATIKPVGDPRELPTAVNLIKNKLRLQGLNMSHEPEGQMTETYTVTNADKVANTEAWKRYKAGAKNVKTGEPLYKASDNLKKNEEFESQKDVIKDILNNKADVAYENRQVAMEPEKHKDPDESDKPYRQRSKAARMRDPKRGINSPAFKKFMADRGM